MKTNEDKLTVGGVIQSLESWQKNEKDTREDVRESLHFLKDKNGQWEQHIYDKKKNSPRYTFDKCNHIVDLIVGPVEESTFSLSTSPANLGGDSSFCNDLNGILRGIEKSSGAQDIYNRSLRKCVESGFDAWIVGTEYKPGSFNQQFKIKHISNSVDRVWVSPDSVEPDSSDAKAAAMLTFIPWGEYNGKYKNSEIKNINDVTSIDDNRQWNRYWYKPEGVNIGTYFWCEKESVEIALLKDGSVVELPKKGGEASQINESDIVKKRMDGKEVWYSREFTGKEWLSEKKKLPFKSNPIVTLYGNFDVVENKRVYRGAIQKLMDAQRVLNYAKSREIEEGALAPRTKFWMAMKQATSRLVKQQLKSMNTSADPVQFYDHAEGIPQPYQGGANNINPHLSNLSAQMAGDIEASAGKWAAQLGKNPANQSGVALQAQVDQAALSDTKWGLVLQRAIKRTFDIIIEAMPVIMDVQDTVMSIDETGTPKIIDVNKPELVDGQLKMMNEITSDYNIDVTIGPAYGSAQKQANAALLELAAVKPEVLQRNGDIFMSNITAPGMDLAVERERMALLQAGQIPPSQMTDEEKLAVQAQQQQGQPQDPAFILEQMKIQENMLREQNRAKQLEIEQYKLMQKDADLQLKAQSQQMDSMGKAADIDNTIADTAKKWAETEKVSGESTGQQIDNMQKVTPQVTIISQQN